jgi:hypothetical protein
MRVNFNELNSPEKQKCDWDQIKPGTIWQINQFVGSPLEFSQEEQQYLYSDTALKFLSGDSPPRYVMVVREAEPVLEQEWQIVSVMVLSVETDFISDVDLLIPAEVSGVGRDLLAQTWHVLPMLTRNLSHSVGKRLSRQIYDLLLSVGDCDRGSIAQTSLLQIQSLGLKIGAISAAQQPEIQAFHRQEEAWSDVLKVPLAAYQTYLKTMKLTGAILDAALQIEREFSEIAVEKLESDATTKKRLHLSQWFENIFAAEWQPIENFWNLSGATCRSSASNHIEEISALINQLSSEQNERKRRQAAKRLGEIGASNSNAINALSDLLRHSQDDETLWTAVESLWQIDPGNPAVGVSRARAIDLGMQIAGNSVALAVTAIKKTEQQVGILLRVYPTGNEAYLPTDLKLILLDESEQILREVTARRADSYIQIKLSGQPGERFSVKVALEDASITEDFAI